MYVYGEINTPARNYEDDTQCTYVGKWPSAKE